MEQTNFLKTVKRYSKLIVLLCASIVTTFCGNNTDFPEVNPLAGYLAASGFDEDFDAIVDGLTFEMGISFIPKVDGQIKAVVVKVPDDKVDLRITIWDKNTATVLRTINVDVAANTELTESITPLSLEKDKEYFITMNTNDYFYRTRDDLAAVTYPFVVGDISITSYSFESGLGQIMPTDDFYFENYSGDLSFVFQEVE
jgi:hypothetical protein